MEALIYDQSPIAEYLDADSVPLDLTADPPSTPPSYSPTTFAPPGLPKLRERLRTLRQTAVSVSDVANERFLERFRYAVIASQLLYDDPKPRRQTQNDQTFKNNAFSIKGALITALVSFSIAWVLNFLRRQFEGPRTLSWFEACVYTLSLTAGGVLLLTFGRRKYLDFIRRSAGSDLERVVADSHKFDTMTIEGLRFVQEVEVVSRGYEIGTPMPPISRLEDKMSRSRCRDLRATIAHTLTASISHCVEAHNAIQPFVRQLDLRRYHDLYEVSMQEFTDAVTFANGMSVDTQDSLKELRFLFRLHWTARKVFLCDLLALHSGSTWYNILQWRSTSQSLQAFDVVVSRGFEDVRAAVVREEFGEDTRDPATCGSDDAAVKDGAEIMTPPKAHTRAQLRRFEAVANAIRSLNAKAHLLREEMNAVATQGDDSAFSSTISRLYENLGADIRNTLVEWEKGRNTMFLSVGAADSESRFSRGSIDIRSPASPSPSSLGGLTIVDGGPAEAFRLLNGEERGSSDSGGLDEEVFEAVAMPRKRMSWTPMSREEKLSRLREERRKRATLQEQAETTTNMLRELQMVIKHRPNIARPDTRIASL